MTEQELLNKLNTVVRVAQEKILTLLTDVNNEQAMAKTDKNLYFFVKKWYNMGRKGEIRKYEQNKYY